MFGPNVKADFNGPVYHHRGAEFHKLLDDLERAFHEKFGLDAYDFLFVTGSGSLVNEIVMSSFRGLWAVLFADAEFGCRLEALENLHRKPNAWVGGIRGTAYVAYETSISRFNMLTPDKSKGIVFADMVSAFPYILPGPDVDIFTTVSSKQLGSYPVIGIIGYRKDLRLEGLFEAPVRSVLNLRAHLSFRTKAETMTTPAIPLYRDLLDCVRTFDVRALREKIDRRRTRLIQIVGNNNVLGSGPVVTLKETPLLVRVAQEFQLYRGVAGPQVFLYNGTGYEFNLLCEYLEDIHESV